MQEVLLKAASDSLSLSLSQTSANWCSLCQAGISKKICNSVSYCKKYMSHVAPHTHEMIYFYYTYNSLIWVPCNIKVCNNGTICYGQQAYSIKPKNSSCQHSMGNVIWNRCNFVKLVPPNVTGSLANPSEFYLSFHLNVVPLKSE